MQATIAPTIDELTLADEPANWSARGFEVADGRCQIAGVSLRFAGGGVGAGASAGGGAGAGSATGLVSWSLRDLLSTELDGLPTTRSERPPTAVAPAHPNGVSAIDHIVAMSPAFERSVAALQAAGLDLRRVRDQPTPAGAPRQAFFRLGREILELVQEPAEVGASSPEGERAGGPDRPVHLWGLALLVDDLDRTVELLGAHVSAARPAVQPGRRIATVRRSAGLAVPLALMSADERS
jgi:hypothetical protein